MSLDHNSEFPGSLCPSPRSYKNSVLAYSWHFYCTGSGLPERRAMQWREASAWPWVQFLWVLYNHHWAVFQFLWTEESWKKLCLWDKPVTFARVCSLTLFLTINQTCTFIRASDATGNCIKFLFNSFDWNPPWTWPWYCHSYVCIKQNDYWETRYCLAKGSISWIPPTYSCPLTWGSVICIQLPGRGRLPGCPVEDFKSFYSGSAAFSDQSFC